MSMRSLEMSVVREHLVEELLVVWKESPSDADRSLRAYGGEYGFWDSLSW